MLANSNKHGHRAGLTNDIESLPHANRRRGLLAEVFVAIFAVASGAAEPRHHGKHSGNSPPLSDHLRRDIGLAPESPRSPAWQEIRW